MWNFLRNFSGTFDSIWIYGWTDTCDDTGGLRTDWNGPESVKGESTLIKTILEGIIIHELRNQNILFDYFKNELVEFKQIT